MLTLLSLLIAAAQPTAPAASPLAAAPDPVVIALVAGEVGQRCLPDRSLCLDMSGGAASKSSGLTLTAPNRGRAADLALPYADGDGETLGLWPYLIAVPRSGDSPADTRRYLMGIIAGVSAPYSGGGGAGSRLRLLRLDVTPSDTRLGAEVLDVEWDSSLMIRACFSEQDMEDRLGACHDEYDFKGSLTAAPDDGGELPPLVYRSVATAYPQTSRRSEDNSGRKLKRSDLTHWRDTRCSYERTLRYNPATARYEMDRPAPDCSDYTTP